MNKFDFAEQFMNSWFFPNLARSRDWARVFVSFNGTRLEHYQPTLHVNWENGPLLWTDSFDWANAPDLVRANKAGTHNE